MKRVLSFIVTVMFAGQAWAQTTFEIGNLKYTVTDETNHYVSVGKGSTAPTGELKIPSTVTNSNTTYTVTSIGGAAFYYCNGLTSVTIPNSVTSIGGSAFYGCSGLTTVTIHNSITSIGDHAFRGCRGLISVTISNSVTSIGISAFCECSKLTEINVESDNMVYSSENGVMFNKEKTELICYPAGKTETTYTIPNSVTSIVSEAFADCSSLTSVTIPNSVTSIGYEVFYGCIGLTEVVIGNSVTSIDDDAFHNCIGLTSVTIPNSVTSIGHSAFYNCSSLATVTIGNSVTSIAREVFSGCSGLTSVTIGNSVTYIGSDAFRNCSKLTSVTIPNSVTSIGNNAFYNCSRLATVTIGNSVTSISSYAFYNCSGLTAIAYDGTNEPTILTNAFKNVNSSVKVCVPENYSSESFGGFGVYKGHHKVTDQVVPPTCTKTGLTEGSHCSYCGKIFVAQEVIPTLDHTYSSTITAPTCTAVGYTTHTCSVCEFTYYSDTVDANGHTYSNTVTAPTCTAVGYTTHTCSVCEYTYNSDTIDAKGHTYSNTVVNPTCTEVGYTTHNCSVCELTYYSDTVDAKGHKADSVEFENIIPATCTVAGSKDSVVFCSVCQVEISREERAIPALGHTYSNTITAPTCTEVGYTTHTCSVCEYTYYSDTVAANGHTEVVDAAVVATCTEAGKTEGKHCSVCNETILEQTEIPALGHEFKDYVYNNDATTTADGTETATCTRGCGATDTRTAAGTKLAETPENGTAVSDAAASTLNIYAHHNTIVVEKAIDEISIYNAMGTLISRDATPCVRTEINVNAPGVYIVKTGNVVKRVLVN